MRICKYYNLGSTQGLFLILFLLTLWSELYGSCLRVYWKYGNIILGCFRSVRLVFFWILLCTINRFFLFRWILLRCLCSWGRRCTLLSLNLKGSFLLLLSVLFLCLPILCSVDCWYSTTSFFEVSSKYWQSHLDWQTKVFIYFPPRNSSGQYQYS